MCDSSRRCHEVQSLTYCPWASRMLLCIKLFSIQAHGPQCWLHARINHSVFIWPVNLFSGPSPLREHKVWPQDTRKPLHFIIINLSLPQRRSHLFRAIVFPANSCLKHNLCNNELWNLLPVNPWSCKINRGVEYWLRQHMTLEHEEIIEYVKMYLYTCNWISTCRV